MGTTDRLFFGLMAAAVVAGVWTTLRCSNRPRSGCITRIAGHAAIAVWFFMGMAIVGTGV